MKRDELERLRRRVSTINRAILEALNRRLRVAGRIRAVKAARGLPMHDPAREEAMLRALMAANAGPLTASQLHDLFRQIFGLSLSHMERQSQSRLRVHRKDGDPDRRIDAGRASVGGGAPVLIAGPCAVEDRRQLVRVASHLRRLGCRFLRGGAFKPRTSPYAFQGMGIEGWRLLREVADGLGMAVVSEVLDPRHVEEASRLVDVLQVGSRNMYNYELLKLLGRQQRPVLLKRGFMATLDELLLAAEYVVSHGNDRVILCERGIRTFERWTRSTLDISAVPLLKQATALPVVVDVAHAAGRRDILVPLGKAALAAGADGLMLEVHPAPGEAASDSDHQLDLAGASAFVRAVFGPGRGRRPVRR